MWLCFKQTLFMKEVKRQQSRSHRPHCATFAVEAAGLLISCYQGPPRGGASPLALHPSTAVIPPPSHETASCEAYPTQAPLPS